MPEDISSVLREATKDLLYMSESDEPFEVVHWKTPKAQLEIKDVIRLSGHKESDSVKITSPESFFEGLIKDKAWYGPAEKEDVRKYRNLVELVNRHLSGVHVFRIGSVQVHVYIIGKTKEGDWAGIKTVAVET